MTLPASGAISFNAINVELGVAGATSANINQASYRTLAGVPSGTISLASFYGKANQFSFNITSNQANANLRSLAIAAGWNGTSKVLATINSGIYVYSTSTGTPGLTVDGSWPGGIFLTNNGYIMGMGGGGATAQYNTLNPGGTSGGPAISLGVSVSITNNSYIGGGGGGGGGTRVGNNPTGGGGAGGGAGGYDGGVLGGAGGAPGSVGSNGTEESYTSGKSTYYLGTGGGGGRIMPGSGGQQGSSYYQNLGHYAGWGGGAGGGGGGNGNSFQVATAGGSAGAAGGSGGSGSPFVGMGGGGWGASGGTGYTGGGGGGKAINLNGYTASFITTGTVYGAVS